MPEANVISAHMEVVGSDGAHVGTVDSVEEHRIKLTKSDSDDGEHHHVPTALVQDIRGNTVTLTVPATEAVQSSGDRDSRDELPEDPQAGVATSIG